MVKMVIEGRNEEELVEDFKRKVTELIMNGAIKGRI